MKEGEIGGTYSTEGKIRNAYRILSDNLDGKSHFRDLSVVWRIVLKCILKRQDVRV
jgi:hypothetical protein